MTPRRCVLCRLRKRHSTHLRRANWWLAGLDNFSGFFWAITSYFHLRHSPSCLYTTLVAREECIAFIFRLTVLYVIFARERAKEQTLWLYSNPFLLERSFSTRSSGIVTSS